MRATLVILLVLGASVFTIYTLVLAYPYKMFSAWVSGESWNKYYEIKNFRPYLLGLEGMSEFTVPVYKEDYPQLWKDFQLGNAFLPLPVRHPLYSTLPILKLENRNKNPVMGVSIFSPENKKLASLFILSAMLREDYSFGQELFKLPFVRNKIRSFDQHQLWRDVFSLEIKKNPKTLEKMIYELYILHVRSKIIPSKNLKYSLFNNEMAVIELESSNKDYKIELILKLQGGRVFSYLLESSIQLEDGRKLRSKFLNEIEFKSLDLSYSRVLYTEFKQLNYSRQFDQEGMLYLFSAWSQDPDQVQLLKEMIFYLERGKNNKDQLKNLYEFAFKHYGKTFTTKDIFSEIEDPNLALQRRIEIEKIDKRREAESSEARSLGGQEMTDEEKQKLNLKKAKEDIEENSEELKVY